MEEKKRLEEEERQRVEEERRKIEEEEQRAEEEARKKEEEKQRKKEKEKVCIQYIYRSESTCLRFVLGKERISQERRSFHDQKAEGRKSRC